MRNNTLYRRMWYIGRRNIKIIQTVNRILLALIIFVIMIAVFFIVKVPILTILQ